MNQKRYRGHLSGRQRAVINDMLKNGLDEFQSLEKHKISHCRYRKWLENGFFMQEFNARINAAMQQSQLSMVRCIPQVAERLTQLTASEKVETARKACLDVITLRKADAATEQLAQKAECEEPPLKISDEKAAKMLAILAEKET